MVRLTLESYDHKPEKDKKKPGEMPVFAQSTGGFILEIVKIVVITLAIIIPIRYFLFQPFYVRGASMEPSFHDKDYLIIDEITYRLSEPKRGDVVVVKNPHNPSEFFIKRLVGLPGETFESKDGQVIIYNTQFPDGQVLREEYLSPDLVTSSHDKLTLGNNEYFIMGDNRSVSLDSRVFGPLPRKDIIGRAWLRVWPFSSFQHFVPPIYPNLILNTYE